MRILNSLTIVAVLLTGRTLTAQSTTTMFPTLSTAATEWVSPEVAAGCPQSNSVPCNSGTQYATNSTGNAWLALANFREYTNPSNCSGARTLVLPPNSRISSVSLDVQCRYDNPASNQNIRWRLRNNGGPATSVTSSPDFDTNSNNCTYRVTNIDITDRLAQIGALTPEGLSQLTVEVSREALTGGSLRVSAVRLIVTTVPLVGITAAVSPGVACATYQGNFTLTAGGAVQGTVEWYSDACGEDGTLLGTGATLVLSPFDMPTDGTPIFARCVLNNQVVSNCAQTGFTEVPPPVISITGSTSANVGQTLTLTAVSNRPAQLSYIWSMDGVDFTQDSETLECGTVISGAFSPTLVIQNLRPCATEIAFNVSATENGGLCEAGAETDVLVSIVAGPPPILRASRTVLCEDEGATPVVLYAQSALAGWLRWHDNTCDGDVLNGPGGQGQPIAAGEEIAFTVVPSSDSTGVYAASVELLDGTPVTACSSIAITRQARAQVDVLGDPSVCTGQTLALQAQIVGGVGPFSGRWYLDGTALSDSTRASGAVVAGSSTQSLTISHITSAEDGSFAFRLTEGGACSPLSLADSATVVVAVSSVPAAGQTARNLRECAGGQASFFGTVSNDEGATMYWRRNGTRVLNGLQSGGSVVSGANSDQLTVTNLSRYDEGAYDLFISNECGSSDSLDCQLLVLSADVGGTGGVPGVDGILNNNDFIVYIDLFFSGDPRADIGEQGGIPGQDGQFDNNDFVVFNEYFFAGGCTQP